MAILKYNPPPTEIRDNRNQGKGYYDAKCEVCGTLFYPKRSNAKYCTTKCALIHHRIAVANGTAGKRKLTKSKANETLLSKLIGKAKKSKVTPGPGVPVIYNGKELRYFLKEKYGIPMYSTKDFLQGLENGAAQKHGEVTVKRISPNRLILV